jgi:enoyl-CoA hydratase/carnithine racemase
MENKAVILEIVESTAIITFNRPERYNAVNHDLIEGINYVFSVIKNDDNIRAVVLTGNGKGFCAGADLTTIGTLSAEDSRDYIIDNYKPILNNFLKLRKPIIGAINGTAAGVGAAFALACDFRVMSKESALLYAFINIGLGPDGGASWLLSRQVGYSKALEIATGGKRVMGEECFKLGITKQDMIFSLNNDLLDTIEYEAKEQVAAFHSEDLKEGVSAFLEKRKANFKGK